MITPNRCAPCVSNDESIPHPFISCSISLPLWTSLLGPNHRILEVTRAVDNMKHFLTSWPRPSSGGITFFLCKQLPFAVCRILWCHRNDRIFKEQMASVTRMKFLVKELIWSCLLIDRRERRFRQDWTYREYCIPGFVGFYYATTINNSTLVFLMFFESRLGLPP
ncbi:hypothetical protein FRX31_029208 [Thalictrum thalictroides]|uniref:Reverse transcriptase zinc-binding domain-containing protein n=1 Tax=Thalictrum thalictroides TaxID=46969 RepID=A0A7J6VAF7_THATH|nr:hypothetical protein FRX31_029208 [Thalictrum thalictroides]